MFRTVFCAFVAVTSVIYYFVNSAQKQGYMDEIFHYPQALKFYEGLFSEWDPKITTPPGLYMSTVVVLTPLSKILGWDLSSIEYFRLTNVFFIIGIFGMLRKIFRLIHNEECDKCYVLYSSLNLAMFPVLYFFTFLYYTDCGSTFFVLYMYYWHLQKRYLQSAICAAVACFFRQTNIVWVFYVSAERTLYTIFLLFKVSMSGNTEHTGKTIYTKITAFVSSNWKKILVTVKDMNYVYIVVALGFLCFVFVNGSVALGDKKAHEVSLNIPQFLYFQLFVLFFAGPILITPMKVKRTLNCMMSHPVIVGMLFVACAYSATYMSHVHPYLLADNRHLTFYIWRRLLSRNYYLSLALVILYIYTLFAVIFELQHLNVTTVFSLMLCIFIALVPQKLLDFRYFIIPYLMLRIHMNLSKWQLFVEFLLYASVNCAVLYLFLFKTFHWHDSNEVQRFMW